LFIIWIGIESNAVETLHIPLSGYGTRQEVIQIVLDRMGIKEPSHLEEWDEAQVSLFIKNFIQERFPTVLVLNKVDQENADTNIVNICKLQEGSVS